MSGAIGDVRKGSSKARRALESNLKIEWVEPLGNGDEPCYQYAYARDIAAVRRRQEPRYESDEAALEDFMVIYWADIQESYTQMTLSQIAARESIRELIKYPNSAIWDVEQFPTLEEAILHFLKTKGEVK